MLDCKNSSIFLENVIPCPMFKKSFIDVSAHKWVTILLMGIFWAVSVFAQFSTSKTFPAQYKKQNRDAISWIVDGKVDTIIRYFESYLEAYPHDLESQFGLAIAYTQQENIPRAMEHVQKAVNGGLPMERFIAGPKELLKPLIQSQAFQAYKEDKYSKLLHGPLPGNFTDRSVNIWLRTEGELQVEIRLENGKQVQGKTLSENDYTTILKLDGLQPATTYAYRLYVADKEVHKGTFTTFPTKQQASRFQIGFGGGAGYTPHYERMWDSIRQYPLTAFLQMGDNIYHDLPEYPSLQDYCYYRRQSRPEYRRFIANTPIYAIWDDHDFGDNDCYGGTKVDEPAWKIPVWEKFQDNWVNPYYGGGRENPGCYFDFSIGDVDFIMLDCRYYRTNGKDKVKPDTMLGAVQQQWLFDKLRASTATFKVIGTSVPISSGTKKGRGGGDTWDGFAKEREEIFSFIEENRIEGVFFVAADRHRSDAWKTERENGYAFYEFMSSRLTNIHTHPVQPESLFGYSKTPSFGLLNFDTRREDPQVTYRIMSIENEEIHRMTLYKSQLKFE